MFTNDGNRCGDVPGCGETSCSEPFALNPPVGRMIVRELFSEFLFFASSASNITSSVNIEQLDS